MTERRGSSRRAIYVPAKLHFAPEDAGHDCLIVNVSDGGIAVEVEFLDTPPRGTPPKEVILKLVTGETMTGTRQWSDGTRIGLKLADPAKLGGTWTD